MTPKCPPSSKSVSGFVGIRTNASNVLVNCGFDTDISARGSSPWNFRLLM